MKAVYWRNNHLKQTDFVFSDYSAKSCSIYYRQWVYDELTVYLPYV